MPAPVAPTYLPGIAPAANSPKPTPNGVMGKGRRAENLGNITGQRSSGLTTIGGGDPMAHSVNQYSKGGLPVIGGGQAPYTQQPNQVE